MITVKLKGGLGNQMFQYAVGRYIAYLNDSALAFNTSVYRKTRTYPYPFHLDKFLIMNGHDPARGELIKEQGFAYDPNIVRKYKKNIVLDGYWQDERYFNGMADELAIDFTLDPEYMSEAYKEYEDRIKILKDPVFVHIRRGERVDNEQALLTHGLIPELYYHKAMDYINKRRPDCTLLFFSDDAQYVSDTYPEVNIIPPMNDYEHFSLMKLCNHAIIPNSTFSWWAAWLIQNPDKIIVAPANWTTTGNSNKEIVPKGWVKM